MELLIQAGADVNIEDRCRNTPLIFATGNKYAKCVNVLINAGAYVNRRNEVGHTALTCAASEGHYECAKLLINTGADVNAADSDGYTALTAAANSGSIKCVQLLLRSGARINAVNFKWQNTLIFLAEHRSSPDVGRFLLAAGKVIKVEQYPFLGLFRHFNVDLPEYLQQQELKLCLKHLCREAIRKRLIFTKPHLHLFDRVFDTGLSNILAKYLIYNMSLEKEIVGMEIDMDK